jgi:uncharacterized protein with HEPN domain
MKVTDQTRLRDMLDMSRRIQRLVAGKEREALEHNDMLLGLAIIRALEVVGEAAANLSEEVRTTHPQLPWKQMIGMRNYLIHRYASVDLNVVWDTATTSIESLIPQIEAILNSDVSD